MIIPWSFGIITEMIKGLDYIGVGVGAVIFNKEGKIFLSKRGKKARNDRGKWECPGGALEYGDSFEDTIVREIKEEFGVDIKVIDQLATFNHIIPDDKQHWVALAFVCKIIKGEPKILEPEKCEEIGWYTLPEMAKMNLTVATGERLRQIIEKKYPEGLSSIFEEKQW